MLTFYHPKSFDDFEGVVDDPVSSTEESLILADEILDAAGDDIVDEVEIPQDDVFDTKHTTGIDFSSLKAYLQSDPHARHVTPIQDIECALTEEIFNETEGWQLHQDDPSFKTWTKNMNMGGRHCHCIRWKRFIPDVTAHQMTYVMSHPNVRPTWDRKFKSIWFSEETYQDKVTCADSECRIFIADAVAPFPFRRRYSLNWCKLWGVPIPTKEGQEQKYKIVAVNRSCRHPDVLSEIQEKRKGQIAIELINGISHHEDEFSGARGCWQTNFIIGHFGSDVPAWAMKFLMSPLAMKLENRAVDVVLGKLKTDPQALKQCEEYCQSMRRFVCRLPFDHSNYETAIIEDHNSEKAEDGNIFSSSHNKSERLQRKHSSSHSVAALKVTVEPDAPLQKSTFLKRCFHRLGSFFKRKAITLDTNTGTPSEADTVPETPKL